MKKLYLFLITSFLFPLEMITVSGSIKDTNDKLIEGVNIYTDRTGISTNKNGSFSLKCFPDEVVTFSHVSYSDITLLAKDVPRNITMKLRNINADEIIVRGGSFDLSIKETNNSLMVIQNEDIESGVYQHFDDVINLTPNLNSSGGTSRSRYFQIRGIGELSQFSGEGAPHFYVGYIMDDIDFSGIGMVGLLNDIDQIEVFKGPQSSIYGPNAMAGMINISSNDPTPHREGKITINAGDYNYNGISGYFSSSLLHNLFHRLSFNINKSDGFRENNYLDISNSNKIDESMLRYKLLYSPNNKINFKLTYYLIDINNGYDMWSADNNGYTTYSDYLGKDTHKSNAFSFKSNFRFTDNLKLTSITSLSSNNIDYNYDSDWANDDFWKDNYDWFPESNSYDFSDPILFPWGYYPYSFTDETTRKRDNVSQDLRITSKNTIGGLYISRTKEDDLRKGYLMGGNVDSLASFFEILSMSVYASTKWDISDKLSLITRLRAENNNIKSDVDTRAYGFEAGSFNEETNSILWGGRVSMSRLIDDYSNFGFSISKGYKSHGFNQSINIGSTSYQLPEDLRTYESEDVYNMELSYNYNDKTKFFTINSFYMHRMNPQLRLSYQLDPSNPSSFDFYTVNAEEGYSYGFEGQFKAIISDKLYIYDNFAILKSHISTFDFLGNSVGNRTEAHAPEFSASGGFEYKMGSGIYINIDHSVMFDFYHEDQYESKTDPYQILNATIGWKNNKIQLNLWAKNLLDEKYEVRGYNFALEPSPNDPPHFFSNTYISYGDPRHFGLSASYSF